MSYSYPASDLLCLADVLAGACDLIARAGGEQRHYGNRRNLSDVAKPGEGAVKGCD